MFEAVLFDFDGTLVDTAPELADAVNMTLDLLGRPHVDETQVRSWIGFGSTALLKEALSATQGSLPAVQPEIVLPRFNASYRATCGTRSSVFPGAREALEALHRRGVPMALVTNKDGAFTRRILDAHRIAHYFSPAVFGDTLPVHKPDSRTIAHCLQHWRLTPPRALMVGDSPIDVQTARNAGTPVWLVSYGYCRGLAPRHAGADRVIPTLVDLLPHLRTCQVLRSARAAAGDE